MQRFLRSSISSQIASTAHAPRRPLAFGFLKPSTAAQSLLDKPGHVRSRAPRQLVTTVAMGDHNQRSMDVHGSQGAKVVAAAADRNKDAILGVIKEHLASQQGTVLEVASGTGQHSAHFAAALPHLAFQPTEYSPECFASMEAWREGLPNMLPPAPVDASAPDTWPAEPASCCAVVCANMAHISPLACTTGLVAGAGRVLAPGGLLFIYGPFLVDGKPTTESNAAFDASLRARNPEWGYRDVADITRWASEAGLRFVNRVSMPANNFTLIYRKE